MSSSVHTHSKSSLFLIELIVSLCFFSLASVVCVRLFVYAHKVSTESRRETLAIQMSQNAANASSPRTGMKRNSGVSTP